jgi:N utilization substance protein B
MRRRTRSREFALQLLYEIDISREDCDTALANFWQTLAEEEADKEIKDFTEDLVRGVVGNLELIDSTISKHATNWQLKRMPVVDRNILRLSCYELCFRDDIPPKVSINEAVELAKKYSELEAGKFVNAVLDKIKLEKGK